MTLHCDIVRALPRFQERFRDPAAIVIPAFNEAAHLPDLLARCLAVEPALVLVVNDASTDSTREALDPWVGIHPGSSRPTEIRALHLLHNHGKQGAVRRGFQWVTRWRSAGPLDRNAGRSQAAVALIDGDGQHDPRELPTLAALLDRYDGVIGLRTRSQMPRQRRLSNRLVNLGFRLLSGVHFGDVQSGLRVYRPELARILGQDLDAQGGYGLEHASLTALARHAKRRSAPVYLAAAPITCAYGEAESSLGTRAVVQLARQTVREAIQIRRLAA